MPKTSKKPIRSKLIKKLDVVFSQWVRLSNADHSGYCTCITCEKRFHWKEIQAGHFMSRKHYSTRWDENNVHPQCVACNVYRAGEQYKYSVFLGQYQAEELYLKSQELVKYTNVELQEMINDYSERLENIT